MFLFGYDRGRPRAGTAVARDGQARIEGFELVDRGEKTTKTAVDDGDMLDKREIPQKKGLALVVENGEIRIRVCSRPRAQAQASAAQVEPPVARDRTRGQHDRAPLSRCAEIPHQGVKIIGP